VSSSHLDVNANSTTQLTRGHALPALPQNTCREGRRRERKKWEGNMSRYYGQVGKERNFMESRKKSPSITEGCAVFSDSRVGKYNILVY